MERWLRSAKKRRQTGQGGQGDASDLVDQFIDIRLAHQFVLLLRQPQLKTLGLDLDVISIGLRARRLLPLAPQVSQLVNAALIEREAVTVPLTLSASSLPM